MAKKKTKEAPESVSTMLSSLIDTAQELANQLDLASTQLHRFRDSETSINDLFNAFDEAVDIADNTDFSKEITALSSKVESASSILKSELFGDEA